MLAYAPGTAGSVFEKDGSIRQGKLDDLAYEFGQKIEGLGGSFFHPENALKAGATRAVSYTHLDVYKRQCLFRLPDRNRGRNLPADEGFPGGFRQADGFHDDACLLYTSRLSRARWGLPAATW